MVGWCSMGTFNDPWWIKIGEAMNMIVRRWWNWYGTTKSFRTSPLGLRNPITCFPSSAFRCGCKPPVVLTYYWFMMTIFHCCNTHSEPWHPHVLNQMTGEIPIFSIKNPGERWAPIVQRRISHGGFPGRCDRCNLCIPSNRCQAWTS